MKIHWGEAYRVVESRSGVGTAGVNSDIYRLLSNPDQLRQPRIEEHEAYNWFTDGLVKLCSQWPKLTLSHDSSQ